MPLPLRILGIETSCDETAAAVVAEGAILSSVVASQLDTHGRYGGVVPELASREHLRAIVPVTREALARAQTSLADLSAIAVTAGPGLVGSLLVGITYAKALSFACDLPLIGVNHIEGHIHAVVLESARDGHPIEVPALALVVSGGHTHLFEVLEGFFSRRLDMDLTTRGALASRIASALCAKSGLQIAPDTSVETFLEAVAHQLRELGRMS